MSTVSPRITRSRSKVLGTSSSGRKFGQELSTNIALERQPRKMKLIAMVAPTEENIPVVLPIKRGFDKIDASFVEVKKLKISEDEKEMNGAPEGELFEVTVRLDEDLPRYESVGEEELQSIFDMAHSICTRSGASWADKYSFVECVRSISINHKQFFLVPERMSLALTQVFSSAESLRSSEIRNGILAIQGFFKSNCSQILIADKERAISLLIGKASMGPKFICEMASTAVAAVVELLTVPEALTCLSPLQSHKSPEAANKATMLLAHASKRLDRHEAVHLSLCPALICAFSKGLSSKRPTGVTASKEAIAFLKNSVIADDQRFEELVREQLDEFKSAELIRASAPALQPKPATSVSRPVGQVAASLNSSSTFRTMARFGAVAKIAAVEPLVELSEQAGEARGRGEKNLATDPSVNIPSVPTIDAVVPVIAAAASTASTSAAATISTVAPKPVAKPSIRELMMLKMKAAASSAQAPCSSDDIVLIL